MPESFIPLRDWTSGHSLPPGTPFARLLWIRHREGAGPVIGGTCSGVAAITVRSVSVIASVAVQATVAPTGDAFEAVFVNALDPIEPVTLSTLDAGGVVLDGVTLALGWAANFAEGTTVAMEKARNQFLAGTSDRVLERRAFSLLLIEPAFPFNKSRKSRVVEVRDGGNMQHYDLRRIERKLAKDIVPLRDSFRRGELSAKNYLARLPLMVTEALEIGKVEKPAKKRSLATKTASRVNIGQPVGGLYDRARELRELREHLEDFLGSRWVGTDFGHRVGLMFQDRLRYRPAGLLCGEQLYSLALLPGEEVQLRQVVETKRKAVLEDIKDREEERNLSLNATWSTDVTEGRDDASNNQSAFGFNASVSAPTGAPIGASVGVNADASEAHSTTASWSTRTNQQQSTQATARQRSQHKIRMEITTEEGSVLSSTRTIKNLNRQRSVTHIFSKLYRREQALLERYGVRLCLRLPIVDPMAGNRGSFLAGLDRLDPNNPELYQGPLKDKVVTHFDFTLDAAETGISIGGSNTLVKNLFHEHSTVHWVKRVNLANVGPQETIPPGFVLADTPVLELRSFERFDTGGHYHSEDGTGTLHSLTAFYATGGSFAWEKGKKPLKGAPPGEFTVVGTSTATNYGKLFENHYRGLKKIKLRLTAEWVPSTSLQASVQAERDRVRVNLIEDLEAGAVQRLRESIETDLRGTLIAQAAANNLVSPASFDLELLRQVFDFEEAVVEIVPYWATALGRINYQFIKQRLESLPAVLPVNDLLTDSLTAAQAVVYLPVREDTEARALEFVPDIVPADRAWLANQVLNFRQAHFASENLPLPDYRDVSGPQPPSATQVGATDWTADWERPQNKFLVLAQWQEVVPTDGVHVESRLSDSVVTDEHQTAVLRKLS